MGNNNSFGYLIFHHTLMYISLAIPLAILPVPLWVTLAVPALAYLPIIMISPTVFGIVHLLYSLLLRPGLYIWALVFTIGGKQDFIAIAFYILFALQLWSIIKNFMHTLLTAISTIKNE